MCSDHSACHHDDHEENGEACADCRPASTTAKYALQAHVMFLHNGSWKPVSASVGDALAIATSRLRSRALSFRRAQHLLWAGRDAQGTGSEGGKGREMKLCRVEVVAKEGRNKASKVEQRRCGG